MLSALGQFVMSLGHKITISNFSLRFIIKSGIIFNKLHLHSVLAVDLINITRSTAEEEQ